MPNIPRLSTCCGCISLETGAKIIGWLQVIVSVVFASILGTMSLLAGFGMVATSEFKDVMTEEIILIVISTILFLLIVLEFSFSICLLRGIYKKKPHLINIWIVVSIVLEALSLPLFFTSLFDNITPNTFNILASFGFRLYFIWVVYSYKLTLSVPPSDFSQFKMDPEV